MPDAATVNGFVQHAVVSAVALGALGVVLRRVLGVFETAPAGIVGRRRRRAHRGAATAPLAARRSEASTCAISELQISPPPRRSKRRRCRTPKSVYFLYR